MRISYTRLASGTCSAFMMLQVGCGDDASTDTANPDAGGTDGGADGGEAETAAIALDAKLDADAAAKELCRLSPWVLGGLNEKQLPSAKVRNTVREDTAVFINDKPPICIDDADSDKDLCIEKPSEAVTYTYLYRDKAAAAGDPVEQVWCKSDNFADLALIAGAEKATRGSCEGLQGIVVAWAEAQLSMKSARTVKYVANPIEIGSAWAQALVTTSEEGNVMTVNGPELYAPTKQKFIEENGTVLSILEDDFFGNHYCKVLSPARVLAWLQGT